MKSSLLVLILISMFSSSAQSVNSKAYHLLLKGLLSHSVKEISVNEINSYKNIVFIDSRERKEYEISHIENSLWVGYDSLDLNTLNKLDKSQKIVVYCSVGYRSEKVAEKLIKMGFKDVSNLYGGIFEWKNQDKSVVNSNNVETEKVHGFNKVWGVWLNKGEKVY